MYWTSFLTCFLNTERLTVELKSDDEVTIDPATGLPELPEGLFWRVGDVDRKYGSGGWARGSGNSKPGVSIMEWQNVEKSERTPIYGTRWYNKRTVVVYDVRYWQEKEAVAISSDLFTGHTAYTKDDIPSIGVDHGSMTRDGKTVEWHYEIPVNREGTLWLATKVRKDYRLAVEWHEQWEEAERAKKVMRDEVYGDYPPKSIN
jgi:hypothetical protein